MENENTSLIVRLLSISNKGTALKKDNLLKSYKKNIGIHRKSYEII